MERTAPASLSVYRGQSRRGIGEGPGKPIAHGEQYLAVSQKLALDGDLLGAIRHWMTLDSDPADHQRLQDRLESWSCFGVRNFRYVVRLTPAGNYDRRAAYFSHGRVWSLDQLDAGCDPGLHLGRSEMFEQPWRDDDQGQRVAKELFPELVRPRQIADETQTAARFLAHLYQSCLRSRPLIIAAPISAFEAGSSLHALVSFARGALPRDLRDRCDVRIYTRTPDLFLGQLKARLVVVPEDVAGSALGVRRDASLLDREGNPLAGGVPELAALAYADAVLERAIKIPEGLALFSRRFQSRRSGNGLPDAEDVRTVQITYNLGVALAGTDEERSDFLRGYLPKIAQKLGPGVSWERLLEPAEWRTFPQSAVFDLILRDCSEEQHAPVRELQKAAEDAAARLGWKVDPLLGAWWNPDDDQKLKRLLSLIQGSSLISEAAAAERTSEARLPRIAKGAPAALAGVLAAELSQGYLSRRAGEAETLGELAARPEVFDVLRRAVETKALGPEWARVSLSRFQGETLIELAKRFLQIDRFFEEDLWGEIPGLLFEALRRLERLPPVLAALLVRTGKGLDLGSQLSTWLRLTGLLESASDPGTLDELLAWLDDSALTKLVPQRVEPENLQKVFHLLDRRMSNDPGQTTRVLVQAGWWSAWRWASKLPNPQLEAAAIAWMNVPGWSKREAMYEAWQIALSDLPKDLSEEQMGRICSGNGALRPWPWIPPFEEDQVKALIDRAANLEALARLAVALRADSFLFPKGSNRPSLLGRSRFKSHLPEEALDWLTDPKCISPILDLQQSSYLFRNAGARSQGARRARIYSIANSLRPGQVETALRSADDSDLWREPDLIVQLANRMSKDRALAESHGSKIHEHVLRAGVEQMLINELAQLGLGYEAGRLRSLAPVVLATNAKSEPKTLAGAILRALVEARDDDPCWDDLARQPSLVQEAVNGHPLSEVAANIRYAGRGPLGYRAWETFAKASARRGALLSYQPGRSILPALELAASLLEEGSLGNAALLVIFAKGSRGFLREAHWWRALLRSLRNWSRWEGIQSADDRSDTAVALIVSSLDELDNTEKEAFWQAFATEAEDPEWELPAEFGVKPNEQRHVLSRPATERGRDVHDPAERLPPERSGVRVQPKPSRPGTLTSSGGRGPGDRKRNPGHSGRRS